MAESLARFAVTIFGFLLGIVLALVTVLIAIVVALIVPFVSAKEARRNYRR